MNDSAIRLAEHPPISELEEMLGSLLARVRAGQLIAGGFVGVSPSGDVMTMAAGPAIVPMLAGVTILQAKLVQISQAPAKRSPIVRATGLPS